MKNLKCPIGNRALYLPTCSAVPQPTVISRTPCSSILNINISWQLLWKRYRVRKNVWKFINSRITIMSSRRTLFHWQRVFFGGGGVNRIGLAFERSASDECFVSCSFLAHCLSDLQITLKHGYMNTASVFERPGWLGFLQAASPLVRRTGGYPNYVVFCHYSQTVCT
jgi:hypothetical protein